MRVKRFFAADSRQAMRQVRDELGDDAVILSNKELPDGVEVVCAVNYDLDTDTRDLASALKESKRTSELQDELDAARQRILAGASFDSSAAIDNPASYLDSINQQQPQADWQESKIIQAMESEIQSLRKLLHNQILSQEGKGNPAETYVRNRLKIAGFSEDYIQHLLGLAQIDQELSTSQAWDLMLERLTGQLLIHDEELIEKGGVVAVFGPTGVGKTTTLSKLAARYVLKYGADGLALVTTDCYRIAAYEQLRTVGRILSVTVRVVDENNSLDATLKSLKRKSLILIDTAGLNVKDPNLTTQINLLASSNVKIKRFLVMPTTSQAKVLAATYEAYKNVGLNGCILTKVDEATNLGETLGLVLENRLPIAYVTHGQKIPDDLSLANKKQLLARFVKDIETIEAS